MLPEINLYFYRMYTKSRTFTYDVRIEGGSTLDNVEDFNSYDHDFY